MIKLIVLVSSVLFAALAEDWEFSKYPKEFSKNTTVIQLTQKNFNTKTKLGYHFPSNPSPLGFQHIEKPWFILFWSKDCPACPRLIPIWEELAQKQAKRCNIAAVNVEKHPDLKDRFLVDYLPTMIYFATNDRMYYFDGERSFKKLNRYVAKEQYKRNIREGQKIPTRINTVKKWYHKIFQPIMVLPLPSSTLRYPSSSWFSSSCSSSTSSSKTESTSASSTRRREN